MSNDNLESFRLDPSLKEEILKQIGKDGNLSEWLRDACKEKVERDGRESNKRYWISFYYIEGLGTESMCWESEDGKFFNSHEIIGFVDEKMCLSNDLKRKFRFDWIKEVSKEDYEIFSKYHIHEKRKETTDVQDRKENGN